MKARRHILGEMNRLEAKYAAHLDELKAAGAILSWRFEAVKFKLADRTFLTPDFWVVMPDERVQIRETKGFWEEDARVKIKVAAALYHEFLWVGVKWDKREGWVYENFSRGT